MGYFRMLKTDVSQASTEDKEDVFYEHLDCLFESFTSYGIKIVVGNFKAKVGSEEIPFQQSIIWKTESKW